MANSIGKLKCVLVLAAGVAPQVLTAEQGAAVSPVAAVEAPLDLQEAGRSASGLLRESQEGRSKGNLGALRSALSIFYGDEEGRYPESPAGLIPKYLNRIPELTLPGTGHARNSELVIITADVQTAAELERLVTDSGKWLYVSNPDSPMHGTVLIDCTHRDARGNAWHRY